MYIKELVEKAKNGDDKAFHMLTKYYEEYFISKVIKNSGLEYKEYAKKELPILLKTYIDKNNKKPLNSYLTDKSFKYKRKDRIILSDKPDVNNKEQFDFTIDYYKKRFYNKIKEYNNYLTDDELEKLSYKLSEFYSIKSAQNETDFRVTMNNRILNEKRKYKKDEKNIVKRYIMLLGPNERMVKHFSNKYMYLLEKYRCDDKYDCLLEHYDEIVKDAISKSKHVNFMYELAIKKGIRKFLTAGEMSLKEEYLLIRNNKIGVETLYRKYSYYKKYIFNKLKDKINLSSDELMELIDIKYREFIEVYVEGTSKRSLRRYLNTRLLEYFGRFETIDESKRKTLEMSYYYYLNLIDDALELLNANYPYIMAKDRIKRKYTECIYYYYYANKNMTLSNYIYERLTEQVNILNNKYTDDYVENLSSTYKSNKILSHKEIDNLTKYYINSKATNKELFDTYLFNVMRSYSDKDAEELKKIKDCSNIKLLRR